MIKLNNISFKYGNSYKENENPKDSANINSAENYSEVKNINLHIKKGECVLLCGKSGCGKTTITRILNGLCPSFYNGELTGEYYIDGRNTDNMTLNELGLITGNVFQDPRSQFFCTNTTDEIVFAMENNNYTREKMQARIEELCEIFPLENLLDKKLFKLSSGEKQIVAIASVCAAKPKVLIMDEPTANLDTRTTVLLANMLQKLKDNGTTIIMAEHRLFFAKDVFDRAILMEDGEVTKEFTREEAINLTKEELELYGLRLFETPKLGEASSVTKEWDKLSGISAKKLDFRAGDIYPLDSASFHAPYGKVLAIIGNNGAGKSSLCRAITGVTRPQRGQVVYNGLPIFRKIPKLKRSFFVGQDSDYQLHSHTVLDEFWAGKSQDYTMKEQVKIAKKALKDFGLEGLEDKHPQSLSGGQKQRLLLAIASLTERELIVFDEPTSGLDGFNMRKISKRIRELAEKGKNVILITHDIELIARTADSVVYMKDGRVTSRLLLKRGDLNG